MNIIDHVRGGQLAHFRYFREGILFYETDSGLVFEVPASDTGNGVFREQEKAINMMRWIRPQIEKNEKAKMECLHGAC